MASTMKQKRAAHESAVDDLFRYFTMLGRVCKKPNNVEERSKGVDIRITKKGNRAGKTVHVLPHADFVTDMVVTLEWETQRKNRQTGVLLPPEAALAKTLDVDYLLLYDAFCEMILILDWQKIRVSLEEICEFEEDQPSKSIKVTNAAFRLDELESKDAKPMVYKLKQLEDKKSEWELENFFYIP